MEELNANFKINLKILPFGQVIIEIKNPGNLNEEILEQDQNYSQPKSTDIKIFEKTFGEDNYIVPQTTGGYF